MTRRDMEDRLERNERVEDARRAYLGMTRETYEGLLAERDRRLEENRRRRCEGRGRT